MIAGLTIPYVKRITITELDMVPDVCNSFHRIMRITDRNNEVFEIHLHAGSMMDEKPTDRDTLKIFKEEEYV